MAPAAGVQIGVTGGCRNSNAPSSRSNCFQVPARFWTLRYKRSPNEDESARNDERCSLADVLDQRHLDLVVRPPDDRGDQSPCDRALRGSRNDGLRQLDRDRRRSARGRGPRPSASGDCTRVALCGVSADERATRRVRWTVRRLGPRQRDELAPQWRRPASRRHQRCPAPVRPARAPEAPPVGSRDRLRCLGARDFVHTLSVPLNELGTAETIRFRA